MKGQPGNKIINLQKMKENGIRVPDFKVLTFEEIVDVARLQKGLERERLENCFREDLVVSFPEDKADAAQGDERYAVRSACSLEDGADQSFAGQFETYLNVRREDCKARVRQCVQSLAAEHVQEYVGQDHHINNQENLHGADHAGEYVNGGSGKCVDRNRIILANREIEGQAFRGLRMDVIIQRMVDAEISGVLFTANPQGILNESVITAGRGLGEGVVSDRVATTTYYYNLTDRLYYYEGEEELLSPEQVEELIDTAERIRKILNGDGITSQKTGEEKAGGEKAGEEKAGKEKTGKKGDREYDIEFAIQGGKIFILQARPITTLRGDAPLILDNSNIVESYPGLSLPLTISFVHIVYGGVFRGVSARVLKNEKELNKHTGVFENMVGHANGRVYYKISNWYTVLKFLPFHKRIIPVWQEMLGVQNKSYDGDEVALSPFVRFMTYVNSFCEMVCVPRNMKKLNEDFRKIQAGFYDRYAVDKSTAGLLSMYQELKEKLFDVWDVTLLNDLYAFIFTGLLKNRLQKKYGKTGQDVNRYISDISDIESMKPIRTLVELAYRKESLFAEEYERQKADYIRVYGDRNLEELKLESKTFRSNPELLEERIESYRRDPVRLKEIYEELHCKRLDDSTDDSDSAQKKLKKDGEGAVCSKQDAMGRDLILRFLEKRAALGIANREISRLNRSRIYGIVRLIFATIGEHFAKDGIIAKPEDVFWLTVDEVFKLAQEGVDITGRVIGRTNESLEGTDEGKMHVDIVHRVAERKARYKLFEQLPAYSRLIFEEKEFDKHHVSVNSYKPRKTDAFLQGVPCSNGEVTAEALVIENVTEAKDVADKILVTKMTDPGWVFLLATAKGIISEKGSLLSHTAIISRELGIPSVVGVQGLLDAVHTGDVIHMDGSTGEIEIRSRETMRN